MGNVAERKKRKKGRPSPLDLHKRSLKKENEQQELHDDRNHRDKRNSNPNYRSSSPNLIRTRRSTRLSINHGDYSADEHCDDDDSDCKQRKKLNHVLHLPSQGSSLSYDSLNSRSCEFESHPEDESVRQKAKKRKLDTIGNGSARGNCEKGEGEPTSCLDIRGFHGGTHLDSGLSTGSTLLPDKKLLFFILERLQKKDTYGVFSEPVDLNELPDYLDIIECPMDFGTVRKKLSCGAYINLEQFESDVFLIASNAMQYNAPVTVYFKQARAINELAKKDFESVRQGNDLFEAEPKVVRRGRPPKYAKKPVDQTLEETGHSLRNGCLLDQNETAGPSTRGLYLPRSHEARSDNDFTGSIYHSRHGKKLDNRRDTYGWSGGGKPFDGERKILLPVGLHWEFGYARSLARFAAKLGHTPWRIASEKIERSLPPEVMFGRGWIGGNEDCPSTSHHPLPKVRKDSLVDSGMDGMNSPAEMGSRTLPVPPEMAKRSEGDNAWEGSSKFVSIRDVDSKRSMAESSRFPMATPPDLALQL